MVSGEIVDMVWGKHPYRPTVPSSLCLGRWNSWLEPSAAPCLSRDPKTPGVATALLCGFDAAVVPVGQDYAFEAGEPAPPAAAGRFRLVPPS